MTARVAGVWLCILSLLACLPLSPAATLPSQFIEENIGGTWSEAVGLVFAPDGRMFVWERGGRVWTVENGVRSAQPFLDISEEVAVWNNYGLLGFCLHPDFYNNGYVYLLYVADRHHVRYFGTANYNRSTTETHVATIGRITRYTARATDGFRSIDPASRLVLVGQGLTNGFPLVSGQHGVGTILFGADGTLLASCGDGASSSITDTGNGSGTYYSQALADGIIRQAENVGAYRCQLVDSLCGKIIRIDPATGDGLPSNPFYDPAAPRRPASRVWALGLKTPSRLTLRPGTGEHHPEHGDPGVLYIGDVGWNDIEDLNICDRPGLNFGWPAYEGMEIQPDYYNANVANLDAPNPLHGINGCNRPFFYFRELIKQDTLGVPSWPNPCNATQQIPASIRRFVHARPVIDWAHGSGPARVAIYSGTNAATINVGASGSPVSGASFGGACSMGGVWYTGTDFPPTWRNTYFHFDYEAQWIKNFIFDTNNRPVQVRDFATAAGGVVYVTTHPLDGGLYYITWDSTVRRIRYVATGNLPPTAVASADRVFGPGPLNVQFTGAASRDPENLPLAYAWNFGDGSPVSTNANPAHTFAAPVNVATRYDVTLRVTDRSGATNSTALAVFVNNTPPAVTILSPTNGTLYPMTGDTLYDCVAVAADAGPLSWAWQTILHHNNHIHSEPIDTNEVTTTILAPEGCDGQTYFYRIVLTVTDALGLSSSNEVRLFPDCQGSLTNAPPGATNAPPAATNSPPAGTGSILDPSQPPGVNFDLSHWYLGTPDADRSLSVAVAELMAGYTSAWFYTGPDGAMVFWAPVNGGTTAGSTFPRSELREQINPPDNSVNWPAFGTHVLDAQCKVKILPSTGKVIIGQIHGYLGDARPLLKLMFDNGGIDAQVKESPSADPDLHYYFPNIPLNSLITYHIVLEEGLLTITINGVTQSIDLFNQDPAWADQTFYFKAGSYVQDNSGDSTEGGRVDFYQLSSAHASFPPAAPFISMDPASQSVPAGSNVVLSVSAIGGLPLSYQWFKDNALLPGASQSLLSIRNVQPGHAGSYHAVVSNAAGTATSAPGQLIVFPSLPAFTLAEALDTTNLAWTTTGSPAWHGWFGAAHDGIDQAQSGLIGDGQTISMQTTVTGPGQVSFWWKVSSETNDDFLTFSIGSSPQASISGSVDWEQRSFNVPSGSQVLRWSYAKGPALAAALDRAWVDQVRFGPQPAAITSHPTNRTVDAGATLTLNVTATGAAPLTYRWQCSGTNLLESPTVLGTATPILTLSNVQPAQSGPYNVVVANAASTVTSSNALLTVNAVLTLSDAVDATQLVWTTTGSPPWVGQTALSRDGEDAARSGAIGNSQTTSFQTTVNGPGTLEFWWKVSSEPSNDRLLVYRGSTELARITGEVDWQFRTFSIPSGSQTLRWTYSKNSSTVRGQDGGWVDRIVYTPLLPPVAPTNLSATAASMSQINLTWNDRAANEAGFLIERSTNGTTFSPIASLGSNVVSYLSTGLLASTTYQFRICATNAAGSSDFTPPVAAATFPFTEARINFQPASAAVPPGYFVDSGLAFGPRGNGLSYGWNSSRTSSATDRNSSRSPDQRYDTYISTSTSTSTRWEVGVPNDRYSVFIVAGDPNTSSGVIRYSVEGVPALYGSVNTSNRWLSTRLQVNVTDGRLSVSNLAGASNNKLCFIDISRVGSLLACTPDKTAECGRPWSFDKPSAQADPCNGGIAAVVVAGTVTNGTSPCPGAFRITRTWIATDACGNSSSCSQTVTLVDTTAPTFPCPANRTVERGSGWDFETPAATDSCSGSVTVSVLDTVTNQAGLCPGAFAATRTWSAVDACGNSNLCSQTITVLDNTPPVLSCAPGKSVEAGSGWSFDAPATEGILAVLGTTTNTAGFCAGSFAVTRTWSARAACGHSYSNTCSQTVTVLDTTPPELACPADKLVEAGAAWNFEAPPPPVDLASGTNVTLAVLSTVTNTAGHCEGTFTATRTWSATDLCGNSNTCSQTVTVRDTTPPALVCPADKFVLAGHDWSFDAPAPPTDLASGANVTLAIFRTTTNTAGYCEGSFAATRTWSATDACGNSNACSQTVTALLPPPQLACAASQVVEAGTAWTFDSPTIAVASPPLTLAILSTTTNTAGFCDGTFAATRTWSARDACGNSNTCSQTVTVRDNTPPTLSCPGDKSVEAGASWQFDSPSAPVDLATKNVTLTVLGTTTNTAGACEGSFTTTRTWSATDGCGNSNTCSQTITVLDTAPPHLSCAANKAVTAGAGWAFDPPTAHDVGSGSHVTLAVLSTTTNNAGYCPGAFAATRTWSATDACGNSNLCSQIVTVFPGLPPQPACAPDKAVEAGSGWSFDPPPEVLSILANTNLTLTVLTTTNRAGFCEPTFAATRTWTVSDACGNSNACSQTVTVLDTAPPSVACPADKSVEAGSNWSFDAPAPPTDLASGTNVSLAIVTTTTNAAGFYPGTFTATRTWSATDACGNSNTCSQTVTVRDTTPPTLTCSDTNTCNPNFNPTPVATDNADPAPGVTCVRDDGQPLGNPFPPGTNTVTCTATDASANSVTCQFRVILPVALEATGPANQLVCLGDQAVFSAAVVAGEASSIQWKFNGMAVPEATNQTLAFSVVAAGQAGTYCVEITGPCYTITHCAALEVTNCAPVITPIELCTLTQGFFTDYSAPALAFLGALLKEDLILGQPGLRSLAIRSSDLGTLLSRLPAYGPSAALPDAGDQSLGTASLPLNDKNRFSNSLLGQTIALSLSLRFDPNLAAFTLTSRFCTTAAGEVRTYALSNSVLTALADPALGITNVTVAGLLDLAQRGLAARPTGAATLADLAAALGTVNLAFDSCRTVTGCPPGFPLAPINDAFANRLPLTGTAAGALNRMTLVVGHNTAATAESGEPPHASSPAARSVWWQFTPVASGWVRMHTAGSSFDTVLAVYTGDALAALTPIAANDDSGSAVSSLVFFATAGTAYHVALDGYAGDSGNITLTILEGVAP